MSNDIMDNESIEMLEKLINEVNEICHSNGTCTTCEIRQFEKKYNKRYDNCAGVYIAKKLLGDSKQTIDFIESEEKQLEEMCKAGPCEPNRCCIKAFRQSEEGNKFRNIKCSAIYISLKLLNNI